MKITKRIKKLEARLVGVRDPLTKKNIEADIERLRTMWRKKFADKK